MKELQSYIAERLHVTKAAESDVPKDKESVEYIQYLFKPFEEDFKCIDCNDGEDETIAVLEPITKKAHDSISKYTGYEFVDDNNYDSILIGKYDDGWCGVLEYNYKNGKIGDTVYDFLGPHDDLLDLLQQFREKLGF